MHHHPVVLVKAILTDERLEAGRILLAGGVAVLLQPARPSDVIVGGELEEVRVPLVSPQEEGMMLVAVGHGSVLAELLVRLVVGIHEIPAAAVQPRFRSLDPEVVVALAGQLALAAGAFQDALCQRHGSRNAVLAHLLHRGLRVFVYIVARFAHRSFEGYRVQPG